MTLAGYQLGECLYQSTRTQIYRAKHTNHTQNVIVKVLNNLYPTFKQLVQFCNQYTIARHLQHPNIVCPLSLERYDNGYALVMPDEGAISLADYWQLSRHSLEEFLHIAIQLADALHYLTQQRVIHKDIKPANILIHPETQQVKLIDFSISSLLPKEVQTLQTPNQLEGTLAYISPEQTGRMNRGVDYRSDFYSLGVTFYELLIGQLPFESRDPIELVHCHIARSPAFPTNRVEQRETPRPSILLDIILKLMEKNAEERYQSALGLKYDLEKCLAQWQETGDIQSFVLGERDVCDRFSIPDKLYGREAEVKTLLQAFERVSQGATEMMLVAGFSGIGKTAVVNEVHKPIVQKRGYFVKGKFDQFNRDIPFSAFVQAFRNLIVQLLADSDTRIQQWKTKILEAIGENGQVLIEVIPELEKIIGKHPPAIELSGNLAQNRFNLTFQKFTRVFASAEHPLVIFLDDLQWADSASLNLIQVLMADTGHLFLIGAYRDNEVYTGHPLVLTLDELKKSYVTNTITLTALSLAHINQFVADTLKSPENVTLRLSELVFQKTQGNPFFTIQFLKALQEEGFIHFDFELGCWQCDFAKINQEALTNDVIEFMALRLEKLSKATQETLKLAACIGNQFDLKTLAAISKKSELEVAKALWQALQEGFVFPQSEVYKFYVEKHDRDMMSKAPPTVFYKFLHDRVQQAAYSLIPNDQRQTVHYRIGQLLLDLVSADESEERIFDIVNHLNQSQELLQSQEQKIKLSELNLTAGKKALASTAYAAAAKYFDSGLQLLEANSWQKYYQLTLSLYESAIEAEYLNINFSHAQDLSHIVLEEAKNVVDRTKLYELQIQMYMAQSKMPQALDVGLLALELLGVDLNHAPTSSNIQLPERSAIESLPVMQDASQIAVMRLLMTIFSPAYTTKPELLSPIVLTAIDLSLKQGHTSLTAFSYVLYGILLCGFEKDLDKGYYSGLLALKVLDRFSARELSCKVKNLFNVFIKPWKEPLAASLKPLETASNIGFEMGDIEYASYATAHRCTYGFLAGEPLTEVYAKQDITLTILNRIQQDHSLNHAKIWQQLVSILLAEDINTKQLSGKHFDESELLPVFLAGNDRSLPFTVYLAKCILSYLLGESSDAVTAAVEAENYAEAAIGITVAVYNFYYSLALLSQYIHLSTLESDRDGAITLHKELQNLIERIERNQASMKIWSVHAPTNFKHKYELVEAEKHRVLGKKGEASELYDRAIAGAKESGYIQEEALANELAAKFYLGWGKPRLAGEYIIEAYYCYVRWGAKAKITDLEHRYPQFLTSVFQSAASIQRVSGSTSIASTISRDSGSSVSISLDLAAILKANQTLSSEIKLDKLLSSLLSIIIENAGADKCVLMLLRDETLLIKGLMTLGTEPVVLQRIPIEQSPDIPLNLIYRVKHNLQTEVLTNASTEMTLAHDPYIQQHQPRSVLCSPILHQGKLMGILYLENNLTPGAFTRERVELLNLLCAQAAISLENSRLYEQSQAYAQQLEQALQNLQNAQLQLVQSEKMSALGNLVSGVAHEMNNPLGFIAATLQQAQPIVEDIFEHLTLYQEAFPKANEEILDHAEDIDLEFSLEDLPKMLDSMGVACDRLKHISTSLRIFSRADCEYKVPFNIHEGLDSTLLILKHRLKANDKRPEIEVVTHYGDLPKINCFPGQLNQVFMNIIANAIDALDASNQGLTFAEIKVNPNRITIQTTFESHQATIQIADNGTGMTEAVKQRIFDHLFTTKGVGQGTGLGLAIVRQIIEEKHQGTIEVDSELDRGTEFIISLPSQ